MDVLDTLESVCESAWECSRVVDASSASVFCLDAFPSVELLQSGPDATHL